MARQDICFLSDTADRVEMPLTVTGLCSGVATLMQKVTVLMLADASDPTRNYGGSLGTLLTGANNPDTSILKNFLQQAATEVYTTLLEEQSLMLHDLPDDEKLTSLSVVNVVIEGVDAVSVEYSINTQAGEVNYFNIDIPITAGA